MEDRPILSLRKRKKLIPRTPEEAEQFLEENCRIWESYGHSVFNAVKEQIEATGETIEETKYEF